MPHDQGFLTEGEELLKGQSLLSPSGRFRLYMSSQGHVTLYRFELGRDAVRMWRFYCYHQSLVGAPRIGVRGGMLYGTDDRHSRQSGKALWVRPADPNRRASNPIFLVQDDGNLVLYERDAQGNILGNSRNGWGSGTEGTYPAAINPKLPCAMVRAGNIAISANTLIENTLPQAINVSDGQTAVILPPYQSVGAFSQNGPGTLAIDVSEFAYDLDGEGSAIPQDPPNIKVDRAGSTLRLVQGSAPPLERVPNRQWEHLQFQWELNASAEEEDAEQCDEHGAADSAFS